MTQQDYTPELEIPFELADQWDKMLKTKGKCATYWEIARWGYQQHEKALLDAMHTAEDHVLCQIQRRIT